MSERVAIRNDRRKPCRSCGEVHEWITTRTEGFSCATPIAIDPDAERGPKLLRALSRFGAAVPLSESGLTVYADWP